MTQDEQTRWGRWLDSAGVPRVTVNNIPMSFGSRLAWLCEHNAQQGVQLTGGTCAACGEGNVVYDGCCINCGVPATSN